MPLPDTPAEREFRTPDDPFSGLEFNFATDNKQFVDRLELLTTRLNERLSNLRDGMQARKKEYAVEQEANKKREDPNVARLSILTAEMAEIVKEAAALDIRIGSFRRSMETQAKDPQRSQAVRDAIGAFMITSGVVQMGLQNIDRAR